MTPGKKEIKTFYMEDLTNDYAVLFEMVQAQNKKRNLNWGNDECIKISTHLNILINDLRRDGHHIKTMDDGMVSEKSFETRPAETKQVKVGDTNTMNEIQKLIDNNLSKTGKKFLYGYAMGWMTENGYGEQPNLNQLKEEDGTDLLTFLVETLEADS